MRYPVNIDAIDRQHAWAMDRARTRAFWAGVATALVFMAPFLWLGLASLFEGR
jgi:hypothetical protein